MTLSPYRVNAMNSALMTCHVLFLVVSIGEYVEFI